MTLICALFDVGLSSFYDRQQRLKQPDIARLQLRAKVNELFTKSRSSAGSRTLVDMLRDESIKIGRFKVTRLMNELGLICKQPGPHAYKQATVERPDIPNVLNRAFEPEKVNQVWCGDITYIWTGSRWHYLAAILTYIVAVLSVGQRRQGLMQTWPLKPWTWPLSHEGGHKMFCSIVTRAANTAHGNIGSVYGAIE